ncbi:hypothetical protein Curi_c26630 [Gottschalkia acidurici 9a]|uniref:Uncharacterized protein n=1 Tax=Gottschalkia acidurici (strain ATCC 7906 / DSM 604 / BCRC 14475 / CIP 104303 / KCTC 5404 / NCIMB 10678 / 9a) TaxID=1128398 RepID=K0B3A0_GOTA9|nr:hypothetical protein [Gottschalkia acidurici]AFS79657.1 hypothetical protein Curi_c26630 [Gottschalkia acidurici 9a]
MKKVLKCITISMLVSMSTVPINASSISTNGEVISSEQKLLDDFFGNYSEVYKVDFDERSNKETIENKDVVKDFFENPSEKVHEVYIDENSHNINVGKKEDITARAPNIPTSMAPNSYGPNNFRSNWSGTKNFTYTMYNFCRGTFNVKADTFYEVEIINNATGYTGKFSPEYTNGRWEISINVNSVSTYYARIINKAGGDAKNAEYLAVWPYGCMV